MSEPLIDLQGVSKVFYTDEVETHALAEIDLAIARGEYVSIAGPSGCGKSTLLSILGLLDTPTSGSYRLAAIDVSEMNANQLAEVRNQQIGFVFQTFNLLARSTALHNVELPLLYGGSGRRHRHLHRPPHPSSRDAP